MKKNAASKMELAEMTFFKRKVYFFCRNIVLFLCKVYVDKSVD